MHFLLKTEPGEYSFDDLKREGRTEWSGITNATAVMHLREMKPGDELIIYHTGSERRAVGTARVLSADAADPKKPGVLIDAGREISHPVSLEHIKHEKLFRNSPLLKIGRLSVVPLTKVQYEFLAGR